MESHHDVRAIANFVLDLAQEKRLPIFNISINKIVFFLHSDFLVETGKPLVSAKSEAWQYGPVYRELYGLFEKFDDQPIVEKATKMDPRTGERLVCEAILTYEERCFLESRANQYIRIAPFDLVHLSHVRGGPWDVVYNHDGTTNPGMKIDNETIKQHYKGEKVQ